MGAPQQTREIDAEIAALADRQHGVAGRRQLLELGLGRRAIAHRLRHRRLHTLHPGVYAVGHRALSPYGHWMAAVLVAGPGAVLSHRSAAALWELRDGGSGPIHVTAPSKSRSTARIRRHHAQLPADETTTHLDIPVTTPPRTIFDLAADSPAAVEPALREAEYQRRYDRLSLPHLLDRYPRHRGNRAVRAALARRLEAPGRTRSALEELFLALLDRHRLPRPHLNAWTEASGIRFQVDCLWPERRQIVELDGWAAHGTRAAVRDDKDRDRALAAAGYRVTRIPWDSLAREPDRVAADLRRILGDGGPHQMVDSAIA